MRKKYKCPVCDKIDMSHGWTGSYCFTCGYDSGLEYTPNIIRSVREHAGMTRSEIAKKLGYTRATVKYYEFAKTSKPYLEKFRKFMREFYEQSN